MFFFMAKYQQLCLLCKKNRVLIERYKQQAICYPCMKSRWGEIKGEKYKKLFNISEELYQKNYFLRNVRDYFDKYGKLSQKQIDAFKKTVEEMKNPAEEIKK